MGAAQLGDGGFCVLSLLASGSPNKKCGTIFGAVGSVRFLFSCREVPGHDRQFD